MAMPDQLSTLGSGGPKPQAVSGIIQSPFEHDQEILAGNPFLLLGAFKIGPELGFQQAINPFDFLFFPQLQTIPDDL
jgi:hypothetical protein